MRNFKTDINGGLPIVLNDLRFIHNGILEAFKALMSSYGVTDTYTVILSGCERNSIGGTTTISEGYVSIGGELCYVPTHSYPDPGMGDHEYWIIDPTFDPDGNKQFQNFAFNDTYEVRVGKVNVSTVVPSGALQYSDTQTIFEIMRTSLNIGELNEFSTGIFCFKDIDGFVRFSGVQTLSSSTSITIGTVPLEFRPGSDLRFQTIVHNGSDVSFYNIMVYAAGDIHLIQITANDNSGFAFPMEQIPIYKAS